MAADRMNPGVAEYYQDYHPALFRLVGQVAKSFTAEGKSLCVCGEIGGDVHAVTALIGAGISKLSMSRNCVAKVKKTLEQNTLKEAQDVYDSACMCATAIEVKRILASLPSSVCPEINE
jgi:phosphotransferase system enzyme I (PtsI)